MRTGVHTMSQKAFSVFLAVSLLVPGMGAVAGDAVLDLLRSVPAAADTRQMDSQSQQPEPEIYVARTGAVILETQFILPLATEAGQRAAASARLNPPTFSIEFFPDARFDIQMSSESHPSPDVVSLSGHLPPSDLATFSLTATPESYLMTFDDPDSSMLYRVVGDSATGIGQVTEIDRRDMPPLLHAPPLIPPTN